jgi:hypothetical protein
VGPADVEPATYSSEITGDFNDGVAADHFSFDLSNSSQGAFSNYGVTTFVSGTPLPTASVVSAVQGDFHASGTATFTYFFTVLGPDIPTLSVPVELLYTTSTSGPDQESEGDTWLAFTNSEGFQKGGALAISNLSAPESFSGQIDWSFLVGTTNKVVGFANAGGDDASAFLDPQLIIDPSFFQQNPNLVGQVSLVLSDGVGTTSGVPEPALWTLMLLGFGGLGVTFRRRRVVLA